jgi:hypothetical protein
VKALTLIYYCSRMLLASRAAAVARRAMSSTAAASAPPTHVKVALCQLLTSGDKAASLKVATDAIAEAAAAGAKIVALPECFNRCVCGAAASTLRPRNGRCGGA